MVSDSLEATYFPSPSHYVRCCIVVFAGGCSLMREKRSSTLLTDKACSTTNGQVDGSQASRRRCGVAASLRHRGVVAASRRRCGVATSLQCRGVVAASRRRCVKLTDHKHCVAATSNRTFKAGLVAGADSLIGDASQWRGTRLCGPLLVVWLSVCLFVCMSVCLFVCLSVCLYVWLSGCLVVCLVVCMSGCLYV
jgi:hypothetical protein